MLKTGQGKLKHLPETENEQLEKLNDIVIQSIEEEKLLSQKLYEFEEKHPPFSSWLADKVAAFGGSWSFLIVFMLMMLSWMVINVYFLRRPFDPIRLYF